MYSLALFGLRCTVEIINYWTPIELSMNSSAYLAEYLGSFLFILVILMSGGSPLVIGGALAVLVMLIGSVSGAHVNPAVSVAQYLQGSLRPADLLSYVFVQLMGGVSAYYAFRMAK